MKLDKFDKVKEKFELVCKEAEGLTLIQNAGAAFKAVLVVKSLREVLTDEIMKEVFMPLMNAKIGFLTDRNGKPDKRGNTKPLYSIDIVRDAIIDATSFGLLPTFNQFNIIAEKMYPTKEGFTALLKKLGVVYVLNFGKDASSDDSKFAEISVKINYKIKNEDQKPFVIMAVVPKTTYSSYDQLKGKAERRAKKMLYEYVTGLDLGENDGETVQSKEDRTVEDAVIVDQTDEIGKETVKI